MANYEYKLEISAQDKFSGAFDRLKGQLMAAEGAFGRFNGMLAAARGGLLGIAAAVTIGGFAKLVTDTIGAVGALKDLAEQTGSTVEQMSKLQQVARLGGQEFTRVEQALPKLVASMEDASNKTSAAGQAFTALGIRTRDAQGNLRDSGVVLEEVARALDRYEDGANKTAIAQALLGRSGAQLIPFLKDLAENGDTAALVTKKQAEEADKLEKSWRKLTSSMTDLKTQAGNAVIPFLNDVIEKFQEFIGRVKEAEGLLGKLREIFITKRGDTVTGKITGLPPEEEKPQAPTLNPDYIKLTEKLMGDATAAAAEWNAAAKGLTDSQVELQKIMASPEWAKFSDEEKVNIARILEWIDTDKKRLEQWKKDQEMIRQLGNDVAKLQDELDNTNPLDKQLERDLLLLEQAVQNGVLSYTRAWDLADQLRERHARAVEEDYQKRVGAIEQQTELLRMETMLVGETGEHRERVLAVMQATPAIQAAINRGEWDTVDALQAQLDARLDLIDARGAAKREAEAEARRQDDLKRQMEEQARAAEQLQDTITDALMRAFESGKGFAQSFKDTLINVFKTMVLRPTLEVLVKGAMGGLGMGGAGMANASGGGFGMLGGLGGLFSSNGFGGIATMAGSVAGNAAGFFGGDAIGAAAAASGLVMGAASFIPWVGLALMAAQALGAFDRGGPKVGAFAQTSNLNLDPFFSGGDNGPVRDLVTGTQASYRSLVSGFGGRPGDFAFALGYDTDPQGKAQNRISAGASVNGVNVLERINDEIGRDQSRLEDEIASTVSDALLGALLASDIPEAVKELLRGFDGTGQALEAYAQKLVGVNALLRTTNVGLQQILRGLDLSQLESFTDLLGGVGPAVQGLTFYMENFYSATEQATIATESLVGDFDRLGLQLPETRLAFRQLMEGIDLTTEAGQRLYASLIGNVQAIDAYYDRMETGTEALVEAAEAFADNATALAYEDFWNEYRRLNEDKRQLAEDSARQREEERRGLADWLGGLLIDSGLSPLSPEEQLNAAKQQYMAALSTGDANQISGAGSAYLGLARDYYASSSGYNAIFGEVTTSAGALLASPGQSGPRTVEDLVAMIVRLIQTSASGTDATVGAINEGARAMVAAIQTSRFAATERA